VFKSTHVEKILVDQGRAAGVRTRDGRVLKAKRGVVSNASIWDSRRLLPSDVVPEEVLGG
jgi:phytoene dehydrogenase-like protein